MVYHCLNLISPFRAYTKITNKIVSKVVLWRFLNIFKVLCTFYGFCTLKSTRKLSQVFERGVASSKKYMLNIFVKLLIKFFSHICEYFQGYVQSSRCFGPENNQELS